ncbi:MAG: tRNA1(Val) (adenine(37)-N6)-methyltransferase [Myxococcales bacterium]
MSSDLAPRPGETVEEIFDGALRCIQPADGYRFALDSLLLALFSWGAPGGRVLDLGTGSGIVALLMERSPGVRSVVGLELQPRMADIARRNAALAGVTDRVTVVDGDLREARAALAQAAYDQVVANPPYHRLGGGRVNEHPERAIARHEVTATVDDVLAAAEWSIRGRGPIRLIYPVLRLQDVVTALSRHRLVLARLRMVHPLPDRPANQALIEVRRAGAGAPRVEPPLLVHSHGRSYSEELAQFIRSLRR